MSATSKTFQVTVTATGSTYDVSAEKIIMILASGTGSKIMYLTENNVPQPVVVDESPATIATASQYHISVTDSTTSTAFYIQADRIRDVLTSGSGSKIYYDGGYAEDQIFTVTQSRSTIRTAIAAIISSGDGPVTTGLTAFAGGGQANATQLSFGYNEITTVATALDSVKLPSGVVGGKVTVLNDGANIANVYPATGGTINDGAANSPVTIAPGVTIVFEAITTTNWETNAQTVSGARIIAGEGAVATPSVVVGVNDNGLYEVSATQQGVSIGNALVGGWDASGLFTGTISEQVAAAGVTVDSLLIKDGGFVAAGPTDQNGNEFILDADADTSITADTDDQIDIKIAGADDFQITANTFTALSGSSIATDTINETTAASGVTIDSLLVKDGGTTYAEGGNMIVGTVTGTKIGTSNLQKIGMWDAAPDVQPTTGIAAAAFAANTSGIVDDTATFGGYTIGQVVAALKRIGALA